MSTNGRVFLACPPPAEKLLGRRPLRGAKKRKLTRTGSGKQIPGAGFTFLTIGAPSSRRLAGESRSSEGYAARSDEVVAHSRKRLRGSAHSVGNVPDAWIFSFQGSLSLAALRKLNLRIPCGEICPLTFQWTFFCPLSGITQNIFLLFCESVRLRHARFAWSCRAPQHMRTGFSPR